MCRDRGLSVTPQRLTIYNAILEDSSHPSPDTVYQKIQPEHPTITLATVYNTLETFEKHDIISMVTTLRHTVRYDPLTGRHHHIVCLRCKKVTDLHDAELDSLKIPEQIQKLNELVDFSVHFNVVCAECKTK